MTRPRPGRAAADAILEALAPVEPAPPPDAPSLPVLCDNVSRAGRGIASRLDRAATDLTGGDATGMGRQDVWRFEVEIARAIIELRGLAAGAAAWRHQRDAEVARAHEPGE